MHAIFSARQMAGLALDLIMPPLCVSCAARVVLPGNLCAACWSQLSFIEEPCCAMWGEPFAYDAGPGLLSARALARPAPWSRFSAAVIFNDQAAKLVHGLKYHDRMETAALMAKLMWRAGQNLFGGAGVLVPVPLHRFRLWRRRFNQAGVLAHALAQISGLEYRPELLMRHRQTRSQVGLRQKEREANLREAFSVPESLRLAIAGKRVVLVDDVLTTGSTLWAAAETLLNGGASEVDAAVFALVPMPGQGHI
ncbi:MAG TPA: ComF family protein [Aestuariivirgaceae bacterium]|nr:ComF family protein [Aestuariivirgaceae bacterium]